MELVPIIQISLALFAGLLLLVLLISYIVFKTNKPEQRSQNYEGYGFQNAYPQIVHGQNYTQMEGSYNDYSPYYEPYDNQDYQQVQAMPAPRRENASRPERYKVVNNDASSENKAYYPERSDGYKHRFAPNKNTNAFAQFK